MQRYCFTTEFVYLHAVCCLLFATFWYITRYNLSIYIPGTVKVTGYDVILCPLPPHKCSVSTSPEEQLLITL
jgi:hypothetical protein